MSLMPISKQDVFTMIVETRRDSNNKLEITDEYKKGLKILHYIANSPATVSKICSNSVSDKYFTSQLGIEGNIDTIKKLKTWDKEVNLPCVIILAINKRFERGLQKEVDAEDTRHDKYFKDIARNFVYSYAFCFENNIKASVNKPAQKQLYLDIVCSETIHKFGSKIFSQLADYALKENYDTISLSSIPSVLTYYYNTYGFKFSFPYDEPHDFDNIDSYKILDVEFQQYKNDLITDKVAKKLNLQIKSTTNSPLDKNTLDYNLRQVKDEIRNTAEKFANNVLKNTTTLQSSTPYIDSTYSISNGIPMELFISDRMRNTDLFKLLNDTPESIQLSTKIYKVSPLREGYPRTPINQLTPPDYSPIVKTVQKRKRRSELEELTNNQTTFPSAVASMILNQQKRLKSAVPSTSSTSGVRRSTRRLKTGSTMNFTTNKVDRKRKSLKSRKSKVVKKRKTVSKVIKKRKSLKNRKSKVVKKRKSVSKVVKKRKTVSKVVKKRKSVKSRKSKVNINRKQ